MAHSQERTTVVETGFESNPRRSWAGEVGEWFGVDLLGLLTHDDLDGMGLTPELSEDVRQALLRCMRTLELGLDDERLGDFSDAPHVTTIHGDRDNSITATLDDLDEQLESLVGIVENHRTPDDPNARLLTAYVVFLMASGWEAERLARAAWASGGTAQDRGGIDLFLPNGDPVQLGSITRANGWAREGLSDDYRNALWAFDGDGDLHLRLIGDGEDATDGARELAGELADDHPLLEATLIRRSHGGLALNRHLGRAFRFLWW